MSSEEETLRDLQSTSETTTTKPSDNQSMAEGDSKAGAKIVHLKEISLIPDDFIYLRVITSDMTNVLNFRIKTGTKLARIKCVYCMKLGLKVRETRFIFDGHRITDDDTAKSLGMIDGDVIEIFQETTGGICTLCTNY